MDTALREAKEETGVVLDRANVLKPVYRDTFRNPKYPSQNNATHYVVVKRKLNAPLNIRCSDEHQDIRIFSEEAFESLATCTDEEWTDGKGGKKIPRVKEEGKPFMLLRKKEAIRKAFQAIKEGA